MFKILLLLLPLVAWAENKDSYDMQYFGEDAKLEMKRLKFEVEIVLWDTQEQLTEGWKVFKEPTPGHTIRGFTLVNPMSKKCFINIIPPKIWDDRETMAIVGHELFHCTLADHSK